MLFAQINSYLEGNFSVPFFDDMKVADFFVHFDEWRYFNKGLVLFD